MRDTHICMAFSTVKASIKSMAGSYSLIIGDEESEPVPYGDVAEIETSDGKRFISFVEADGENVEPLTEYWAYEVLPIKKFPSLTRTKTKTKTMRMRATRTRTNPLRRSRKRLLPRSL